jgi:hypothetical protein
LVQSFEDYYEKEFPITVVQGQSDYDLPRDFLKAIGVDATSGGITYSVPRYMPQQRNYYRTVPAAVFAGLGDMYYRIVGQQIRFIPSPIAASVTLRYVRQYKELVADTDLVDEAVPQGWEEYVVVDTAARMLMKEESDAAPMYQQKQALLARITAAAESRDAGEPWRITDVATRGAVDWYSY